VESPHLSELQKKYADRGLVVLAVNAWDEDVETVREFVTEKKLTHTVLLNGGEAKKRYGIRFIPVTICIDRDGRISSSHAGFRGGDEKELERMIQKAL
jgi:hypothetical protein